MKAKKNLTLKMHLLARLLGKAGLSQPELTEDEELAIEEGKKVELLKGLGLPHDQLGQDFIERNVFFDASRANAVVDLKFVNFCDGRVVGLKARLWRDFVRRVHGAKQVALVSRSICLKRPLLNELLAAQNMAEYVSKHPSAVA